MFKLLTISTKLVLFALLVIHIPYLYDAWQLNSLALETIEFSVNGRESQDSNQISDWWVQIDSSANIYSQRILYQQGLMFQNLDFVQIALQKYNEALNQNSLDIVAVYRIGELYERLGRGQEALEAWRTEGGAISMYFVNQGTWYTHHRNWEKANAEFQRSVLIDPSNYYGYLGLATVSRLLEDWVSAIDAYEKALSVSPNNLDANYYLGVMYLKIGDFSASREQARKTLAEYPNYVWAYVLMGDSYRLTHEFDQAADWYRLVTDTDDQMPLGLRYLGINSLAQHDTLAAFGYFEQALAISSEAESYFWLGQAYAQQREYNNALRQFEMATRLSADNLSFHLALADIYLTCGRTEDAISEYRRVLELAPGNTEAETKLNQLTNGR